MLKKFVLDIFFEAFIASLLIYLLPEKDSKVNIEYCYLLVIEKPLIRIDFEMSI